MIPDHVVDDPLEPVEMLRILIEYRQLSDRLRAVPDGSPEQQSLTRREHALATEIHSWHARLSH